MATEETPDNPSTKFFYAAISKSFNIPVADLFAKIRFVDICFFMAPKTFKFDEFYALLHTKYPALHRQLIEAQDMLLHDIYHFEEGKNSIAGVLLWGTGSKRCWTVNSC